MKYITVTDLSEHVTERSSIRIRWHWIKLISFFRVTKLVENSGLPTGPRVPNGIQGSLPHLVDLTTLIIHFRWVILKKKIRNKNKFFLFRKPIVRIMVHVGVSRCMHPFYLSFSNFRGNSNQTWNSNHCSLSNKNRYLDNFNKAATY